MFGLLNINKPPGVTSRDVVNQIQRKIRPVKVGHAGTLDPLATGVLVLCLGRATRLVPYVQRLSKRYTATFLLGRRSDTDDVDGKIELIAASPLLTQRQIEEALPNFIGEILQRPPAYSAIKVRGQRAYHRARLGEHVEIAPRPVRVFSIALQAYEYPKLTLQIVCGSGTYVRSIGRDLAELLGTGGVLSELERTAIGDFRIEDALRPDQLVAGSLSDALLPATTAVAGLPHIQLTEGEALQLAKGLSILRPQHGQGAEVAAIDSKGRLAAILRPKTDDLLSPVRNFGDSHAS